MARRASYFGFGLNEDAPVVAPKEVGRDYRYCDTPKSSFLWVGKRSPALLPPRADTSVPSSRSPISFWCFVASCSS